MATIKVINPGITQAFTLTPDFDEGAPLEKLKSGATLEELKEDYVFFTYSPLFLLGGLTHNPIQEWINRYKLSRVVFIVPLDTPILRHGLPDTRFDSLIWAVEKKYWRSLAMHLGTIGLVNHDKKTYVKAICQEMPIVDVVALKKMSAVDKLPMTTIYTFGVDSNKGCFIFQPPDDLHLFDGPWLRHRKVRENTAQTAARLFNL